MPTDILTLTSQTSLTLTRPGTLGRDLRAWDAADELLLSHLLTEGGGKGRVLVIDDQFGALSAGLASLAPVVVLDSARGRQAAAANLQANGLPSVPLHSWIDPPEGRFDTVVLRIPRQLEYLDYLLRWANDHLTPDGRLWAAGMIRHIPERCAALFAERVVTDRVLPARKKARVVVARPGDVGLAGWPRCWLGYREQGLVLQALPAVFAREQLDIGSRLLLPPIREATKSLPAGGKVLDLGCGNGLLGLTALATRGDIHVCFSDVSSQAVLSARANAEAAGLAAQASFSHADGVNPALGRYHLILLNPPFHEGGTVGDHLALSLFSQARKALMPGGRLLVVGNRHLGYHATLKRSFAKVRQLDANPKFVVFSAEVDGKS
ncbi:MAG: methyltransferase [Marinobacter sp.]|nr:methyltransferase [Marinobacter sp.]